MTEQEKNNISDSLYRAILALETTDEARRFFRDLLTEPEIEEFARRWQVAGMLDQGVPYTQITEQTGLSSTTVARISKWLKKGKGGYRLMLDRMNAHNSHTQFSSSG